jgi:uracil-DNA glycosylase family 4
MPTELALLENQITECTRCPRLVEYRERIARQKRRAFRDEEYWGRPVPAFGDPEAEIVLIGLAPAAHGANRTGRMFTGDSSGDFLYRTLYSVGLASQPESRRANDGLTLKNVFITATARCAPPDNKPTPREIQNCRPYLARELQLLPRVRAVLALGRIAFDDYLTLLRIRGDIRRRADFVFAHNRVHRLPEPLPALISSYHPSQQNTATGKLTFPMFQDVFRTALKLLDAT